MSVIQESIPVKHLHPPWTVNCFSHRIGNTIGPAMPWQVYYQINKVNLGAVLKREPIHSSNGCCFQCPHFFHNYYSIVLELVVLANISCGLSALNIYHKLELEKSYYMLIIIQVPPTFLHHAICVSTRFVNLFAIFPFKLRYSYGKT